MLNSTIPTTDKKWEITLETNKFKGKYYSTIEDRENAIAIGTLRIIAKHQRHFKNLDELKIQKVASRKIDMYFMEELAHQMVMILYRLKLFPENQRDYPTKVREYVTNLYYRFNE